MSDQQTLTMLLDKAGIPYRVCLNQMGWSRRAHTVIDIGEHDDVETDAIFGLGGGYFGMFGFDADGRLLDFGVVV